MMGNQEVAYDCPRPPIESRRRSCSPRRAPACGRRSQIPAVRHLVRREVRRPVRGRVAAARRDRPDRSRRRTSPSAQEPYAGTAFEMSSTASSRSGCSRSAGTHTRSIPPSTIPQEPTTLVDVRPRGGGRRHHADRHASRASTHPARAPREGVRRQRRRVGDADDAHREVPCPARVTLASRSALAGAATVFAALGDETRLAPRLAPVRRRAAVDREAHHRLRHHAAGDHQAPARDGGGRPRARVHPAGRESSGSSSGSAWRRPAVTSTISAQWDDALGRLKAFVEE